jgi:hypothetical protein
LPVHLLLFLDDKENEMAPGAAEKKSVDAAQLEEHVDERDESAALEEAALDLIRLDRYEREAWSLQKRAIFAFMSIKLMKAMAVPQVGSVSAGQTFPLT